MPKKNLVVAEQVSIEDTPTVEMVVVDSEVEDSKPTPKLAGVESTDDEVNNIMQKSEKKDDQPETEVIMKKTFTESVKPKMEFKPVPEEFYNTLFYFSGMGNVIGSALAEGVYVPEHTAKRAPSPEAIEKIIKDQKVNISKLSTL